MADNQIVKVVFDFDLGNVPASTKAFTKYMESVGLAIKPTKASADALAASYNQLSLAQTKAGNTAAAAGNQIKKSNMQWTNLALVLQDLPYGFRGIQNNLPALMGGFAGLTGPIYLAGSALIAFFTAWDNGMIKFGNTVKLTTDFSKEAATAYANETIQLESLYRVATDVNVSMDERLIAAQELKKEYPGLLGLYSDEDIALGKADESYKKLTTTIWQYAQVKAAEKTLEEIAIKQNALTIKKNKTLATQKERELYLYKEVKSLIQDEMTFTQRLVKTFDDLPKGPLMMVNAWGAVAKSSEILTDIEKEQQSINDEAKLYKDIIDANITSIKKLNDYTQDPEKNKARLEDPNIKLLEAKKQYYKDDLLMSASYEQEILAAQRNLAVRQAQIEGKSGKDIQTIKDTYNQLILNSQAETGRKILEEQSKLAVEQAKEYDKEVKEEEKRNKERIARGQKGYEDSLKTVSEFYKNKMNLATGDKNQQIAILKEEQAYFDILYGFNLISYEDYVKKTGEITKQQIGLNNALINSSAQATMQLGMAIISALAPAFDMMVEKGASIGEALESVFTNLLKQLAKVIITAAIAVALMAALGLVDFSAIGKTFGMLVSQGMGFPKMGAGAGGGVSQPLTMFDGFANGGIISGPTYGLMGEYPGAQNNPEVVAPLDKLKDMIGGGGGGTFMLRGQDLLLSVNRAQKASNLKGQNISLV
jgi:hypothetical protein